VCTDNIIVLSDSEVVLNDWGSARPPSKISTMVGLTASLCCPMTGVALENKEEYEYDGMCDLRGLCVSLFAFALKPRLRGDTERHGLLPWEGSTDMQATKYACFALGTWKQHVRSEAVGYLSTLISALFVRHDTPGAEVLEAFASLPLHAVVSAGGTVAAHGVSSTAAHADTSPEEHKSSDACKCGSGNQSEVCRGCRCTSRQRACSNKCGCAQKHTECLNPNNVPPAED
jgi:hypothetical protein